VSHLPSQLTCYHVADRSLRTFFRATGGIPLASIYCLLTPKGVPAAFSPTCSDSHVPGYVMSPKTKEVGNVYVVSVNDAFVMKAWGKQMDPNGDSGVSLALVAGA
jgi:hypothetical protein